MYKGLAKGLTSTTTTLPYPFTLQRVMQALNPNGPHAKALKYFR